MKLTESTLHTLPLFHRSVKRDFPALGHWGEIVPFRFGISPYMELFGAQVRGK